MIQKAAYTTEAVKDTFLILRVIFNLREYRGLQCKANGQTRSSLGKCAAHDSCERFHTDWENTNKRKGKGSAVETLSTAQQVQMPSGIGQDHSIRQSQGGADASNREEAQHIRQMAELKTDSLAWQDVEERPAAWEGWTVSLGLC